MQDVLYIETVEQALTLLNPRRVELMKLLDQPRTCPELAEIFNDTPQKIYYHIKALEKADLVEKVAERRVRGTVEGSYRARAYSYWLAPHLVGQIGGARISQDQMSLRFLLSLAEEMIDDIGHLGQKSEAGKQVPSLSLSAHIWLPDGNRRAEFLEEVQAIFQDLARKYGIPENEIPDDTPEANFRLVLACYPKVEK